MTININWNSDQEIEVIDAIRGAIGRDVTFNIVASSTECPTCDYDPVTNLSTNSFCTTCDGKYWIPVYSGVTVSGHITWGYSEQLAWYAGGQVDEGECRVQIKYTPSMNTVVDSTEWVTVDGKKMQIVNKILRGVKEINRILIDLIEQEG